MAVEWTSKQKDVIDTRGRNILVSAAAGSGKTAVLVERIIKKITDRDNPVDVDKLLVVTFTKAAAAEMRERVFDALEKALEENPENEHLQRQQTYIHNAKITTIDSFCAQIVREHFDKIELDPSTRIVDEAQIKMVESDVMEELLEDCFEKGEESFLSLANQYTDPKNTGSINELVSQLYKAAMSHLDPKKWLDECRKIYDIETPKEMENSLWMEKLKSIIAGEIRNLIATVDEALKICSMDGGPVAYEDDLNAIKLALKKADEAQSFDRIKAEIENVSFPRIPTIKKDSCDEDLKKQAQAFRNEVKAGVKSIGEKYFSQTIEEAFNDFKAGSTMINTIIDLTIQFYDRLIEEKMDKCIMDFADQEHYALDILTDIDESGNMVPSMTAREMASQYEEIMIDEYQDSNYIQEAILTSVANGFGKNNVFMVGDVKQSIYKFRLANPNLFIEKYDSYSKELDAEKCKIVLDKNFRSRKEVIDSVNFIFQSTMHRDLGGIEYEDGNELVFGADYYPEIKNGQNNDTEVLLVEGSGNENEIRAIAKKIREMVSPESNFYITDKNGNFVKPKYKDIVILLRAVSSRGDEYVEVLSKEGIPAYSESKSGYYNAREVKIITDFLSIIDNPLQDIPLASVMRSEIYNFTSDELAIIKAENQCEYYYDCIKLYMEKGEKEPLKQKLRKMISDIERYRKMVPYTNVYDLICIILKETGYENIISALPNGVRRVKNIEILKEKAISYDAGAYKGLFNFSRYLDKIKELGLDEGEASLVSENDNIVRIITFHKSKGLQFPVVFASGLGTKFNNSDENKKMAIHEKYGIGVDFIDEELKVQKSTLLKVLIQKITKEENYAEYIRFLYVALTRAQEKMFLTASDSAMESKIEKWISYRAAMQTRLSREKMLSVNTFIDWIGYSVCGNRAFDNVLKMNNGYIMILHPLYSVDSSIRCQWIREDDIFSDNIEQSIKNELKKEGLLNFDTSNVYDEKIKEDLKKNLSWTYDFEENFKIPAKLSVTEIKKLSMEEDEDASQLFGNDFPVIKNIIVNTDKSDEGEKELAYSHINGYEKTDDELVKIVPKFLQTEDDKNKTFTGAKRGTAYHRVFELFDYDIEPDIDNIGQMFDKMVESGKIDKESIKCINPYDFAKFTKTVLYSRMKVAYDNHALYRERGFLMDIAAKDIYKDIKSNETILVQGIIDACFLEDGKYVIVDYKTDNVATMEELKIRYHVQLESYAEAIEKISGVPVKEKIIYSVKLGDEISL